MQATVPDFTTTSIGFSLLNIARTKQICVTSEMFERNRTVNVRTQAKVGFPLSPPPFSPSPSPPPSLTPAPVLPLPLPPPQKKKKSHNRVLALKNWLDEIWSVYEIQPAKSRQHTKFHPKRLRTLWNNWLKSVWVTSTYTSNFILISREVCEKMQLTLWPWAKVKSADCAWSKL